MPIKVRAEIAGATSLFRFIGFNGRTVEPDAPRAHAIITGSSKTAQDDPRFRSAPPRFGPFEELRVCAFSHSGADMCVHGTILIKAKAIEQRCKCSVRIGREIVPLAKRVPPG